MHRLISLYNQNRRMFWLFVLAAIIIGFILWRMVYFFTQNESQNIIPETSNINTINYNSLVVSDQRSVTSGQDINIKENEISNIDNFVSYCNLGKTKEAYELISDECKEELYPTLKHFEELYYKPIFKESGKNASIVNWARNIYKVDLKEDALATGKINNDKVIEEYISLTKDSSGKIKLNINGYIGRKNINKIASNDNIEVKLLKIDTYMDYEFYTFQIKNKKDKKIELGNSQNTNMSYLIDQNNIKHNLYNGEISQEEIRVLGNQEKIVKFKYFNRFISTREIKSVVFPKIKIQIDL